MLSCRVQYNGQLVDDAEAIDARCHEKHTMFTWKQAVNRPWGVLVPIQLYMRSIIFSNKPVLKVSFSHILFLITSGQCASHLQAPVNRMNVHSRIRLIRL